MGNLENRFQGHADFPLTETGRTQVHALAERWQAEGISFDRAISSPLLRARETAEIICQALNIPLELDLGLERNRQRAAGRIKRRGSRPSRPTPCCIHSLHPYRQDR